ncbi:MAG: hypothetical protein KME16_08295 [Scytolyngbya sp. HA4215-MV1]|jgi:hypothetical protein|nr:hypothetical protein [Scytolyngbya sp. HA4215-MV1]
MNSRINPPDYTLRTADYYLSRIDTETLATFNSNQLSIMRGLLNEAIPKSSPKLVDLRFVVDLIIARFYVVLFVGKDRRKKPRKHEPEGIARIGNIIAAVFFLLGANLIISALIVLMVYLLKSAAGINLLPGHFPDLIKKVFTH